MPTKSAAQERLMQGVAHNPAFAKKVGIPQSVGKEFTDADTPDWKVGDKVHLGIGTAGGAGYYGTIEKIEGDTVYIKNPEGRMFRGSIKRLTRPNTLGNSKKPKTNFVSDVAPAPYPGQRSAAYAVMVHRATKQRVTIERKNIGNYPKSEGWEEISPGVKADGAIELNKNVRDKILNEIRKGNSLDGAIIAVIGQKEFDRIPMLVYKSLGADFYSTIRNRSHADADTKHADKPVEAYGVKGVKSTPWRKKFKNQVAFEEWMDKQEGDIEVYGTREDSFSARMDSVEFDRNAYGKHLISRHAASVAKSDAGALNFKLPKPIPNSPYHKKSEAELRYIIKDASEARTAAESMGDRRGSWKYSDQINDAVTVLNYRAMGGKADIT